MKKISILFFCFILFLSCTTSSNVFSVSNDIISIPKLNARHAIIIERTTERILYEKEAYSKTAMASTTKLMTALVAVNNIDISQTTKISSNAASIGGSTVKLKKGEIITIKDLLYCLMLRSGNDAAIAIAEAVSGNVKSFCTLMNTKAKELGALNTNFTSPHGLDDNNHFTTAYDLALICKAASENPIVREIMETKHYNTGDRFLINTNPFLGTSENVTGGKTGFTNNAGRCIALTATKGEMSIIIILIGCVDSKARLNDGNKLLEYVFENYSMKTLLKKDYILGTLRNKRNIKPDARLVCKKDIILPTLEDTSESFTIKLYINQKYYTPEETIEINKEFNQGDVVGKIIIYDNNSQIVGCEDLFIESSIIEKDFLYCLKKVVVYWFCGVL